MLTERRRMCVGLVAAGVATVVRFVGRVDMRMLLAVGTVGEAAIAAHVLATKRFFAYIDAYT